VVKRRGFSLIEVIVALVILEVALLGLVATGIYALQLQRGAESRERALAAAGMLLDSLLTLDTITAGATTLPDGVVRWSVAGGWLNVSARYRAAARPDSVTIALPFWVAE
jgi:Tfp pilus assembly protein PilV